MLEILNEIAASKGKQKLAVLAKNADNELFKRACFLAYDGKTQFYQRKIPDYMPSKGPSLTLEQAMQSLTVLTNREKTGDEAKSFLKFLLENTSPEDAKVVEKIVLKDFDVGIGESSILATWPGLLSEYPILLTAAFKYALLEKLIAKPGKKYAQLKSDGARVNIHVHKDGAVSVFSRKGREIFVRGHFDWLGQIEAFRGQILDGELLARDPVTRKPLPRKTGNGLVNKAIKGTLPENELEILYLTAWDIFPIEAFEARKYDVKYDLRFTLLDRLIDLAKAMHPTANIELIESREIETVEDAIRVGEEYLAMGCEGAIIKHGDMLWGDERSKLAIKIKGERECDLKIVGIQPGEGKYTGMIGAYICESACGKLRVNVGGGLSDDDRAANPDDVIDKILGVLYNEKIKSKSKKAGEPEYSLFLPRVHPDKRIRIDKDVADTLENIE